MFDTHIHTLFSSDSKMDIKEVIDKSKAENIGVCITDHMDLKYPCEGKFIFDVDKLFDEYLQYRSDKLLLGIELGMRPDCIDDNRKIIQKYDFDIVIGSVHVVNNIDIYQDIYYKGRSKKEVFEEYLKFMLDCVKSHYFIDTLGHIDYISRYAAYDDKELYYTDYPDLIDSILNVMIDRQKALEINTRRFNDKKAFENIINIYKRYSELGGKIVTVGSDAHNRETIGKNFSKAQEIAETCNLKIVYFKNRKIEYSK